jgi:alanine racemase
MTKQIAHLSSWVEIDTQALKNNIKQYALLAPHSLMAPVIKSNAYGHDMLLVASVLETVSEVAFLCVVSLSEAITLRQAGIKKPILVLSIIDADLAAVFIYNIEIVVYDYECIAELNKLGKFYGKKARIHIKIDTGLSRLGIRAQEAMSFIRTCAGYDFLELRALFSHLADSERTDSEATHHQLALFDTLIMQVEQEGIILPLMHISCTAALGAYPLARKKLVRLGIGIYGLWPSEENKKEIMAAYPDFRLQPVLTWKTRIIQIKQVPAGTSVGYGLTHTLTQDSTLAVLPIGYADGYDRRLSSLGVVSIDGQAAPIVGRVAMNLVVVDITGLTVGKKSEVILLGKPLYCTADVLAQLCNTINYEVVTRINSNIKRFAH